MMAKRSSYIYRMKGLAIFFVICAHMAELPEVTSDANLFCGALLTSLGALGVPVFFILSGYLFVKSRAVGFGEFWRRKLSTVFLPWIIWATAIYFYVALRRGGIGVTGWLRFAVGVDTPFYYLTSLVLLYLIYFYGKSSRRFIISLMGVSLLMNIATSLFYDELALYIDPFLNVFNWMLYFGAGMLFAQSGNIDELGKRFSKTKYIASAAAAAVLAVILLSGRTMAYWKIYSIPVYIIVIYAIAAASYSEKQGGLLALAGKYSFGIYLLHQPVASIVTNLKNRLDLWILTPIAPIAVFLLMTAVMWAVYTVSERMPCGEAVKKIFGIR